MPVAALRIPDGAGVGCECCSVGRVAEQGTGPKWTLAHYGRVGVRVCQTTRGTRCMAVKTTRQGVFCNALLINFTNSAAAAFSREVGDHFRPSPSLGFGRGMMWKST